MKLLLDTHTLLWWLLGDGRLSDLAREAIAANANQTFVSSVSAMEVATKFRIGKLPEARPIAGNLASKIAQHGFTPLPVSVEHGDVAGLLEVPHRDPFDRLLIAQAQVEQAWLVSNEALFDQFGVRRLW